MQIDKDMIDGAIEKSGLKSAKIIDRDGGRITWVDENNRILAELKTGKKKGPSNPNRIMIRVEADGRIGTDGFVADFTPLNDIICAEEWRKKRLYIAIGIVVWSLLGCACTVIVCAIIMFGGVKGVSPLVIAFPFAMLMICIFVLVMIPVERHLRMYPYDRVDPAAKER